MDDAETKGKKRVLPSWMTDDNSGRKKPRPTEPRKKKTQVSPRRRTVYCMNEKELVECALEVLDQNKIQRDIETKAEPAEYKEDPSPDTDSEEKPPISPVAEKPRTIPPPPEVSEDSDDDPLKYVREIFFS
ncbi:cell cycle regulator of non-homologous end joining isoform X2 [Dendropsophus ebraccatus]